MSAQSPSTQVGPSSKTVLATAKRAFAKFTQDAGTDVAASLTYYAVLAIFPALIALLSLIGLIGNRETTTDSLVNIIGGALGKSADDDSLNGVRTFLDNINSAQGAGIALIIGILLALWSASGYVNGFSRAMNRIWDVPEGRPVWVLRPVMLAVTIVITLMLLAVVIALVASGPIARSIGQQLGISDATVTVWNIAKWPVVVVLVVLIIGLLYWATPNVTQPLRRMFSVGAFCAFVICVVASLALLVYLSVTAGASYYKTYGVFASSIIFLLWIWLMNVGLLLGAEIDAEVSRDRHLRAGEAVQDELPVTLRSDKQVQKQQEKKAKLEAEAARIRDRARAEAATATAEADSEATDQTADHTADQESDKEPTGS